MREGVSIFVLLVCFTVAKAQQINYSGELNINANRVIFYENTDNKVYFTFRNRNKIDANILIWDKKSNTTQSYNIDNKYKKKKLRIISIFRNNGKWLVFAAFWNEKHRKDYLFAYRLNNVGERIGKLTKVAQLNVVAYPTEGLYAIRFSPDKQYFAIVFSHTSMWNKYILPLRINVFSEKLDLIYSRRAHVRFINEHITATQIVINNNLEVFVNIQVDKASEKLSSLLFIPKEFYILSASVLDSNCKTERFVIPQKTINKFIIAIHNNTLHIGGYYSNIDYVSMRGVFFGTYNQRNFANIKTQEFSDTLINQYHLPDETLNTYSNEMLCFDARNIEFDSFGNEYIIGELVMKYTFGNYRPHGFLYEMDETSRYKYGDILISKLHNNSKLESVIVQKYSAGRYNEKISYSYYFNDGKFAFVFNKSNTKQKAFFSDSRGDTQLQFINMNNKQQKLTQIKGVSSCNPLVYKPFRYDGGMYFLYKKKHKTNRLIEINL